MPSNRQIEASRANGRKSRGPVTEEGKRASSRNALKHGVLSECIVLPGELEESFQSLTEDLFEEHRPVGSTEEDLVEMMAVSRWRRMRIWSLEKTCLKNRMLIEYRDAPEPRPKIEDVAGMAFASLANETRTLDLVSRYESRYDRQYFRAHRRLLELQDRRMRNEPDNPPPAPVSVLPESSSDSVDPGTAPPDPGTAPVTPGGTAGNCISSKRNCDELQSPALMEKPVFAKRSQEVIENTRRGSVGEDISGRTRLPHWNTALTAIENVGNPFPLQPLPPDSPEKATVFAALSGVEQS